MLAQGHNAPQLTQAQLQQQAQQQQMATEEAKRRSRKPTDKNMPDGVDDIIIGEGVKKYKDLRDFERRLDATMTRKRLDIIDSINRNAKRCKILRIWITNTAEDQQWQTNMDSLNFQNSGTPSYRVKIEGRLLDDDEDAEETTTVSSGDSDQIEGDTKPSTKKQPSSSILTESKQPILRFSSFFREMTVEYPLDMPESDQTTVHWKKPSPSRPGNQATQNNPPPGTDFDELTFKRVGDRNINVIIKFIRHEEPERYLLSDDLAEIVDAKEANRTEVTMGLWEYIRMMRLQEDDEKRNFRCDELLRKITNRETGYLPNLSEYVTPHLKPLSPISLPYTIRVDQAFHTQSPPPATIYDVRVSVDDSLRNKMLPFIMNPSYATMLKEVSQLDDQQALLVQAIQHSRAKHAFLTHMARNPVGFTKAWISSQKRDLEYIMGEAPRGRGRAEEEALADEFRRLAPWETSNAREAVTMMLAKHPPPHASTVTQGVPPAVQR